jgi:hypothetical protein
MHVFSILACPLISRPDSRDDHLQFKKPALAFLYLFETREPTWEKGETVQLTTN